MEFEGSEHHGVDSRTTRRDMVLTKLETLPFDILKRRPEVQEFERVNEMSESAIFKTQPLRFRRISPEEQASAVDKFFESMQSRRTVRNFSSDPVPFHLIETAIRAAATAPSGANQQPWKFVVVSDPDVKRKIRAAAEDEEREFYSHRAPQE